MMRIDRRQIFVSDILKIILAGGFITAGMIAPGLLKHLGKPMMRFINSLDGRQEIERRLRYMKQKKLIKTIALPNGDYRIEITEKGRTRATKLRFDSLTIPAPPRWDRRWRMVTYDIPEERKVGRDAFKRKLKDLGFYQLQKSVWVYPYPCEEAIAFVKDIYEIGPFVVINTVADTDRHNELVKQFQKLIA